MDAYFAYYTSLSLQALSCLLLFGWLAAKAGRQPGMLALAFFCLGNALWSAGQLAINLGSDEMAQLGKFLLNLGPLNPALYLHFVFRFVELPQRLANRILIGSYALALLLVIGIVGADLGDLEPWLGFRRYYVLRAWGWAPGAFVTLASVASHLLLWRTWRTAAPKRRRQTLTICISGVWGLSATVMFLNPAFGIDLFPYSMIALPGYAVMMVYGILRQDLMAVNHWANRFLVWVALLAAAVLTSGFLISLAARLGLPGLASVPLWQLWPLSAAILLVMLALEGPSRRAMERVVFPGTRIDQMVLMQWRAALEGARDWHELEAVAARLLGAHLRQTLLVAVSRQPASSEPTVLCHADPASKRWLCELRGWEGATPSVRHVGEVFAELLAAAAARLERMMQYAEQEKRHLQEAHLLELGGLAAIVAHDLRNPLNIISMAAASCAPQTRADIREQIGRADHLIKDLLTYSGELRLNVQPLDLGDLLRRSLGRVQGVAVEVQINEAMTVLVDALRFDQILTNLLGNAQAMLRGQDDGRICIETRHDGAQALIAVCDNGPGVPEDMRADLFQPFKSRRPGGTGLGLAIVRRLAEAQGGSVCLAQRGEWRCCFELRLLLAGDKEENQ